MLARATVNRSSCCNRNCSRPALAARPARGRTVTAAAGGAIPQPVITALKKYGAHAKAAYIIYYQSQANNGQVQNISGVDIQALSAKGCSVCPAKDVGDLTGMANFRGVSSMLGYPGNVFDTPKPDVPPRPAGMAAGAAQDPATQVATFMGCISEATGTDGLKELVFAFRGSDCLGDWETNILGYQGLELYGTGNGLVHEGFYNILHVGDVNPIKEMDRVLKPYLDAHRAYPGRHPLPRVITTGHSLGASLAILAALHVAVNIREYQMDNTDYTKRLLQTYAFAAPRVGNPDLGAFMRSAKLHYMAVQVRNKPDGVPYLPPKDSNEAVDTVNKFWKRLNYSAPTASAAVYSKPRTQFSAAAAGKGSSTATLASPTAAPNTAARDDSWEDYWKYFENLMGRLEADVNQVYNMTWGDAPAPSFGVCSIDAEQTGLLGGPYHSLQVYLANLDSCKPEAATG